jgi:hypothetical protein
MIVVPMLAFPITMISLVFANRIYPFDCPNVELCSILDETNVQSPILNPDLSLT